MLAIASMASAEDVVVVGVVPQQEVSVAPATTVKAQEMTTWEMTTPGQYTLAVLDQTELEVISEQLSQTGEQYDYIKAGMASTFLFTDKYGVMRIHKPAKNHKACNNKVIRIKRKVIVKIKPTEVIREHETQVIHEKTEVVHETKVVHEVPVQPVTNVTNNYFSSAPVMCGQIGGQSPWQTNSQQLLSVSAVPVSNTSISICNNVKGGDANVVNNNSNTNVNDNANNNVINIGDGSATGAAVANGNGAAGSGN